jgi:hypothetical protein
MRIKLGDYLGSGFQRRQSSGGPWLKANPGKQFVRAYLKKNHKKGQAKFLKERLNSNPSTAKK